MIELDLKTPEHHPRNIFGGIKTGAVPGEPNERAGTRKIPMRLVSIFWKLFSSRSLQDVIKQKTR
jgi:hypothetical protein